MPESTLTSPTPTDERWATPRYRRGVTSASDRTVDTGLARDVPERHVTAPDGRLRVVDGDLTDADIITRSRTEPERFATVFDRHYDVIHRFLWTRVGRRAEELTAEVFKVAFQGRDRYDPSFPSARPWLFGIASRLAKQAHREEAKADEVVERMGSQPEDASDIGPEQHLDELAPSSPVAASLMQLPARDREPLLLHVWDDLSYEEVARTLDVPIGTVRSRIHRARAELRARLTPSGDHAPPTDADDRTAVERDHVSATESDHDAPAEGGATHG